MSRQKNWFLLGFSLCAWTEDCLKNRPISIGKNRSTFVGTKKELITISLKEVPLTLLLRILCSRAFTVTFNRDNQLSETIKAKYWNVCIYPHFITQNQNNAPYVDTCYNVTTFKKTIFHINIIVILCNKTAVTYLVI